MDRPDLELQLGLDAYAPKHARHAVAGVDRPSPDLRDAVLLMVSDLVTRAAHRHEFDRRSVATLRVWMPADAVRVELWTDGPLYDEGEAGLEVDILGRAADRWHAGRVGRLWCTWFEIDRHPPGPRRGERSLIAAS